MSPSSKPPRRRLARAFAPGHITVIFSPALGARDPRARGSRGVGVVLEKGARASARWHPRANGGVSVRAAGASRWPISEEVARRLMGGRPGRLDVRLTHELPIGQGFGMSAAGALATALSVGAIFGRSRRAAIETAHLAELFGRGGLGGVSSILRGGIEVRLRPGVPPFGKVRHRRARERLLVLIGGPPIPSQPLLASDAFLARVEAAAEESLRTLGGTLTVPRLLRQGEVFDKALGLGGPPLRRLLDRIRAMGIPAAQAMFGRTVVAAPPTSAARRELMRLGRKEGLKMLDLRVGPRGATLV